MSLYSQSDVSVESWVDMQEKVPTRCEVETEQDCATLFFGYRDDFVLHLGRENLRTLAEVAGQAHAALEAARPS